MKVTEAIIYIQKHKFRLVKQQQDISFTFTSH